MSRVRLSTEGALRPLIRVPSLRRASSGGPQPSRSRAGRRPSPDGYVTVTRTDGRSSATFMSSETLTWRQVRRAQRGRSGTAMGRHGVLHAHAQRAVYRGQSFEVVTEGELLRWLHFGKTSVEPRHSGRPPS